MARKTFLVILYTCTLMFFVVPAANAYIDPGSGSMIIQAAVGIFAAIGTALAIFWSKITGRRRRAKVEETSDAD